MSQRLVNRAKEIDFAKGITILTVVTAHLSPFNRFYFDWVVAYNMPFFFMLQGHMQRESLPPFGSFVRKKVKRLLVPSWIYRVLCYTLLWNALLKGRWPSFTEIFVKTIWGYECDWFMPVAFVVGVGMYVYMLMQKRFKDQTLFALASVVFVAVLYMCANLYPFHGTVYAPIKVDTFALAFSFAIMGYWLKRADILNRCEKFYDGLQGKGQRLAVVAAVLLLYTFLGEGNAYRDYANMSSNEVGRSAIVYYIVPILMFVLLLLWGRKLNRCENLLVKWVQFCGRHSMMIYLGHGVFYQLIKLAVKCLTDGELVLVPMENLSFGWMVVFFVLTMIPLTGIGLLAEKIGSAKKKS